MLVSAVFKVLSWSRDLVSWSWGPSVLVLKVTVLVLPLLHKSLETTATTLLVKWKSHNKIDAVLYHMVKVFVAGCTSCRQQMLTTSTGPHPFFNHQQTPEGRDIAPFYLCPQTSVPTQWPSSQPLVSSRLDTVSVTMSSMSVALTDSSSPATRR